MITGSCTQDFSVTLDYNFGIEDKYNPCIAFGWDVFHHNRHGHGPRTASYYQIRHHPSKLSMVLLVSGKKVANSRMVDEKELGAQSSRHELWTLGSLICETRIAGPTSQGKKWLVVQSV